MIFETKDRFPQISAWVPLRCVPQLLGCLDYWEWDSASWVQCAGWDVHVITFSVKIKNFGAECEIKKIMIFESKDCFPQIPAWVPLRPSTCSSTFGMFKSLGMTFRFLNLVCRVTCACDDVDVFGQNQKFCSRMCN